MQKRFSFIYTLFFSRPKEAVSWRCSINKVLLEILENLQENICAKVSFLIKFQTSNLAYRKSRTQDPGVEPKDGTLGWDTKV